MICSFFHFTLHLPLIQAKVLMRTCIRVIINLRTYVLIRVAFHSACQLLSVSITQRIYLITEGVDMSHYIFHIDVNSAYLSWIATDRLAHGDPLDLREIPAVVGGDEKSRHGIVLAKSIPAKAYGIHTGEPLIAARQKCPGLTIVPPDRKLFVKASQATMAIIREYSPRVQQFSIDECFVDYNTNGPSSTPPVELAHQIRNRIRDELGFTVNIGVSTTKILAKMASDFTKPDRVHTLFPDEVQKKMWPLPVSDLFMVGRATSRKLHEMDINTIGALATADIKRLEKHFMSFAHLIQSYANGMDESVVRTSNHEVVKGMGNSTTIKFDVTDSRDAYMVLLSLSECVGMRLRRANMCAGLVAVSITDHNFRRCSRQHKLSVAMNSTSYIHNIAMMLFDQLWDGTPIRKLGVRVTDLHTNEYVQLSLFETYDFIKARKVDEAIDSLRDRYGNEVIQRACFLHSGMKPVTGGVGDDDTPVMTSIL